MTRGREEPGYLTTVYVPDRRGRGRSPKRYEFP